MNNIPLHSKAIETEGLKEVFVQTGRGNIECFYTESGDYRVEVFAQKITLESLFEWRPMSKADFDKLGFVISNFEGRLSIKSNYYGRDWFTSFVDFKRVSFRLYLPKQCSTHLHTQIGDITVKGINGHHRYLSRFGGVSFDNIKGQIESIKKNFGRKVTLANSEGNIKIASGGGNLYVKHCKGDLDFITDGGNVKVVNYAGQMDCKTRGGNISVEGFKGELKATSWGGNIKVSELDGDLASNTMGGNVSLKAKNIENYAWLVTNGGNINFQFNEKQNLDLHAKGNKIRANGNFLFQGEQNNSRWTGQINEGGANIKLKTNGGRIKINGVPHVYTEQTDFRPDSIKELKLSEKPASQKRRAKPKIVNNPNKRNPQTEKFKKEEQPKVMTKSWERLPKFWQAMLALLFITLLTYGFNTITFFSSQMLADKGTKTENIAIFYLNFINGVLAFTAIWIFITLLNHRIRKTWLKYLILSVMTIFFYMLGHGILQSIPEEAVQGRGLVYHYKWLMNRPQDAEPIFLAFLFLLVPVFANISFFSYWNRSRNMSERLGQQQLQLLNLEKLKTKAQLNALEARINPHFLYNSLNSIAGLIHENADQAEDMTIELSKLFRATTGRKNESYHSIEEEISLVKSYLAIEQMRFGERLRYEINLDESLSSHQIPRFLLQPLVENAIKHGISKIAKDGMIRIDISPEDDLIIIKIHDNGPEFGEAMSGGYGLKSVRDKLELIYEGKASLEIENSPIKQLTISIDRNHDL
ncbi:histidine kinase [Jiulongibacter sp. NS-SX5]|uniref:histidine kinase n=1 Tax=Jiulongibacter sp. NS-SX5 TaxID=3463854 RepID=UPI004059CE38